MISTLVMALALAGGPIDAVPSMATASSAASWRYSPQAFALAELMAPSDAQADMMIAEIRRMMMSPDAMEDMRSMDEQYPGLSAEIQKAMEESVGGGMKAKFLRIREGFAEDYQRELSAAEISELLRFYRSSGGQKIARARDEVVDPNEVVRRLVGKVEVLGKNTAARMVIADRILGTLGAAEIAETKAFAATPLFAHFTMVSADSVRLERDLANVRDGSSKSMMQAMMRVIEQRTGMHMPTPGEVQQMMAGQSPDAR